MIEAVLLLALQTTGAPTSPAVKLDFKMDEAMVRRFDVNKDGGLSLREFQNAMESELRKAIATAPGAKPRITKGELAGFRASLAGPFRTFDLNANGSITLVEMRTAVSRHSKKSQR